MTPQQLAVDDATTVIPKTEADSLSTATERTRRLQSPSVSVTKLDRTTAQLIAACLFLGLILSLLVVLWYSNLKPTRTLQAAPLEIVEEGFGGDPDGAPGESLRIDSPEPPSADAQAGEDIAEPVEIPDSVPTEVAVSDVAVTDLANDLVSDTASDGPAPAVMQQFQTAPISVRKPGSSQGTGNKRALGFGPGTKGGVPRELRWFVSFSERGTLDEYATQLDFFGIELGALMPDGKLHLVSKFSQAAPVVKTVQGGADEKRLYFTWRGGSRKAGDVALFQKAGVNANNASMILHFYPSNTENVLANIELDYRKRKAIEIRRSNFVVRRAKDGFEFAVTSQTYLK